MSQTENKISPVVQDMAKKIKANLEFDAKSGVCTEKTESFEACLPEDLSIDTVRRVVDHNANFVAAGALAFGELAVAAMSKNKSLTEASAELKMVSRDSVSFVMEREHTYQNRLGSGDSVTKHGVITSNYHVKGGKNSGQLKAVRSHMNEIAAKALK